MKTHTLGFIASMLIAFLPPVAAVTSAGEGIVVAWGDSLTYGTGATGEGGKSWPRWFAEMSGMQVINKGVGGETSTQIKARMLASPELHGNFTVIWAGHNNAYATNVVKADIAEMVAALGNTPFLVVGVLNKADEIRSSDPTVADRWKLTLIDKLNAELKATYGDRFVDVRPLLVAAYDAANAQDIADHANDVVPSSLRYDKLHLKEAGYRIVAEAIYKAATKQLRPRAAQ